MSFYNSLFIVAQKNKINKKYEKYKDKATYKLNSLIKYVLIINGESKKIGLLILFMQIPGSLN